MARRKGIKRTTQEWAEGLLALFGEAKEADGLEERTAFLRLIAAVHKILLAANRRAMKAVPGYDPDDPVHANLMLGAMTFALYGQKKAGRKLGWTRKRRRQLFKDILSFKVRGVREGPACDMIAATHRYGDVRGSTLRRQFQAAKREYAADVRRK